MINDIVDKKVIAQQHSPVLVLANSLHRSRKDVILLKYLTISVISVILLTILVDVKMREFCMNFVEFSQNSTKMRGI